jgi:asparaginyl-tRNA synthetase
MTDYKTARELFETATSGSQIEKDGLSKVELQGWVRTNRNNGSLGFIELNDGTYFKNVQIVYDAAMPNFEMISKLTTGTALSVSGLFTLTPEARQAFEIKASEIKVEGSCDEDYPLQKKRHTFEFLREIAHLRPRTNTFTAIFRVRSVLSMAVHEFFQSQGFIYLHAPIITPNDAEGAGEAFVVTTRSDGNYEKDYFGKKASLTVSGQLNAEAYALAFRDVYTFGPTFRAEKSNTVRHMSEFWMIEPEIAFADLEDDMNLAEDLIKFCIEYVMENCKPEIEFFNQFIDTTLVDRLTALLKSDFKRMTYTDAVSALSDAVKAGHKFENANISWGMDLQSEHERYLCEKIVNGPVFLINYPKESKAFYMRVNDDNKTVAACDLLVPFVGELIGGSQREERLDILKQRMAEFKIPTEGLEWYLDLRRFGGVKHAGFGVGFERLLMYITGMQNIRDVIPFPRTPKNLEF